MNFTALFDTYALTHTYTGRRDNVDGQINEVRCPRRNKTREEDVKKTIGEQDSSH